MSETESALFADFITGSYLWLVFQLMYSSHRELPSRPRRDKAKMREYRCRIMVEGLAATQARLQDLNLTAHKQKELWENPVGHGKGMI